jgi:nephrocystin-4
LRDKSLTVDIWDADSKGIFGSIKISLRDLLRQGKPGVVLPKQFQIIDPAFDRDKGHLQILLKNVGILSKR